MSHRTLATTALLVALAAAATARAELSVTDNAMLTLQGVGSPQAEDWYGSTLATGDFDGDGRDDLAVGLVGRDVNGNNKAGAVLVIAGGPSSFGELLLHEGDGVVPGTASAYDFFGDALAVGDFDADGYDDLVVGSGLDTEGGVVQAGSVTVLYGSAAGPTSALQLTQATAGVPGTAENLDLFGSALAVGDFDGDGYDDLAVGASYDTVVPLFSDPVDDAGSVTVLYGTAAGLGTAGAKFLAQSLIGCSTAATDDEFGEALAAGDFNGDGFDDLAIGAPGESNFPGGIATSSAGLVHVLPGSADGVALAGQCVYPGATDATGTLPGGPSALRGFGGALAAGNFDRMVGLPGGNRDDLAIGSESYSGGAHDVVVLSGVSTGVGLGTALLLDPPLPDASFCGRALLATDVVGSDASDDLVVGCPGTSASAGRDVLVHRGSLTGGLEERPSTIWTRGDPALASAPGHANDGFATALAVGDLDGDGEEDLVIGISSRALGGTADAGAAQLLYGDPALLFADRFESGAAGSWTVVP